MVTVVPLLPLARALELRGLRSPLSKVTLLVSESPSLLEEMVSFRETRLSLAKDDPAKSSLLDQNCFPMTFKS